MLNYLLFDLRGRIIKKHIIKVAVYSPSAAVSVYRHRASRSYVSARFDTNKMLFFITFAVLMASAQAKFYSDCGMNLNYFLKSRK